MSEFDQRILEAIQTNPGKKARDLATQFGVDKTVVNSSLYGPLKGKVKQDNSYRWYPNDATGVQSRQEQATTTLNTPLAKLCRYYLDCLSHDDLGGVSEFAASKYGDPNYVELESLPMFNENGKGAFDSEPGRQLLTRIRRDRNRQVVFLGYPVRLNFIRGRSGWQGFMVEPLLLFPFQEADNRHGNPTLSDELPQINFKALRSLSNAGDSNVMEEAIQLADDLGLGNAASEQPDLDEFLERLFQIRPEWDWREQITPSSLSRWQPLSALNQAGIYNRCILVAAERSPFTKGLESELGKLQIAVGPRTGKSKHGLASMA